MKNTVYKVWGFLVKNKVFASVICLGLLIFIWYGYRPSLIKENCAKEANSLASGRDVGTDYLENQKIYDVAYNSAYNECLNDNGL
jgi:hypothetical protein